MRHIRTVSVRRPAAAQLEMLSQTVGLIQAILGFPNIIIGLLEGVTRLADAMHTTFGTPIPRKQGA